MAKQIARKVFRLLSFIIGAVLLLSFLLSSPVLAQTLATSPSIIQLEVLPGTTTRVVFSVENRSDNSHTFRFWPAQPSHLKDGYTNLSHLSWLSLDPKDIELASA